MRNNDTEWLTSGVFVQVVHRNRFLNVNLHA